MNFLVDQNLKSESEIISSWINHSKDIMVSISCVVYNHEDYLEDAIKSFLMQVTEFSFEILIHDDASTDSSRLIIEKYQLKYPSIIKPVYQITNQWSKGDIRIGPKFNYSRAAGKYIAICDGDDCWTDKYKLQKQVNFLEDNNEYSLTYSYCQPYRDNKKFHNIYKTLRRDVSATELKALSPLSTSSVCFRNIFKNSEWPKKLNYAPHGDLATWHLLGYYGQGKYLDNIKDTVYRIHNNGVHSTVSKQQIYINAIKTYVAIIDYSIQRNEYEVIKLIIAKIVLRSLRYYPLTIFNILKLLLSKIHR